MPAAEAPPRDEEENPPMNRRWLSRTAVVVAGSFGCAGIMAWLSGPMTPAAFLGWVIFFASLQIPGALVGMRSAACPLARGTGGSIERVR